MRYLAIPIAANAGALFAGLALAGAAPATAQDNRYTLPPAQARAVLAHYAECVVRSRAADVRAALRDWTPGRGGPHIPVSDDCTSPVGYAGSQISAAPATYRYAIAEALYAADYGARPTASYDAVPLSPPPEIAAPADPSPGGRAAYDEAVAERYRLIIADCVVRTAPSAVHSLLTSAVGSDGESMALAAVQPVLAQCLPSGQTARFNRSSLRGVLAIDALRLNAAAPTSGGTH